MNLLPNNEKNILIKGFKLRFAVVLNILVIIALLIGTIALLPSYFLTRVHLTTIFSDFPSKTDDENSTKKLLNLPEEVNSKLNLFQSNLDAKRSKDILAEIIDRLPEKINLNSFLFSRNENEKGKKGITVVFSGIATDRDSLVSFNAALKKSKLFTSVDMPVGSLTKEKNLPFSVNIFITD